MAETIEGSVDYTGQAPTPGSCTARPIILRQEADDRPRRAGENGKLENVWVHVTNGAKEARSRPPPRWKSTRRTACTIRDSPPRWSPEVSSPRNGDPILHNVDTYLGSATLFNKGSPTTRSRPSSTSQGGGRDQVEVATSSLDARVPGVSKTGLRRSPGRHLQDRELCPRQVNVESWHEKYAPRRRK